MSPPLSARLLVLGWSLSPTRRAGRFRFLLHVQHIQTHPYSLQSVVVLEISAECSSQIKVFGMGQWACSRPTSPLGQRARLTRMSRSGPTTGRRRTRSKRPCDLPHHASGGGLNITHFMLFVLMRDAYIIGESPRKTPPVKRPRKGCGWSTCMNATSSSDDCLRPDVSRRTRRIV